MKYFITYLLCFLSAALLLAQELTPLTINTNSVYLLVVFIFLSTLMISLCRVIFKQVSVKLIAIIVLIAASFCFVKNFFTWGGDWKTQTILYQHTKNSDRAIEELWKDVGALGYDKVRVDRTRIIPFIDWIKSGDEKDYALPEWEKVDSMVNELKIGEELQP